MKIKSTLALSLLAACVSFAAPASATVVTSAGQTAAFDFSSVNDNATLDFNGFNAALGTLVGVIIQFTLNETLTDDIFNFGNHPVTIGIPNAISATSTITASGPLGLTVVNTLNTSGFVGTVPVGGPTMIETASSPSNFLVGPVTLSGNATSLASYIGGTNAVVIAVSGTGTQNGSLPPSAFSGYLGTANGVVTLQYEYDIPEPGSIALFALGLIALAAWCRRKA